jgi:hypothetical protein
MKVLTQFGVAELDDNPTTIDQQAEFVFTMGQCHAFALAVNKLTEWQIVADDDITRGKGHLLIRLPNKLGVFDISELHEDDGSWPDVTVRQVELLWEERMREWLEPNLEAAMPYAEIRVEDLKEEFPELGK